MRQEFGAHMARNIIISVIIIHVLMGFAPVPAEEELVEWVREEVLREDRRVVTMRSVNGRIRQTSVFDLQEPPSVGSHSVWVDGEKVASVAISDAGGVVAFSSSAGEEMRLAIVMSYYKSKSKCVLSIWDMTGSYSPENFLFVGRVDGVSMRPLGKKEKDIWFRQQNQLDRQ